MKIGDKVTKTDEVATVVGFNGNGGVIIERGNYYALEVIPEEKLRVIAAPKEQTDE